MTNKGIATLIVILIAAWLVVSGSLYSNVCSQRDDYKLRLENALAELHAQLNQLKQPEVIYTVVLAAVDVETRRSHLIGTYSLSKEDYLRLLIEIDNETCATEKKK